MKPYIAMQNNSKARAYNLGISTATSYIDQKRNPIQILPGFQTVVKTIPQVVGSSEGFDRMDPKSRNCKLPHEVEYFNLTHQYTRHKTLNYMDCRALELFCRST